VGACLFIHKTKYLHFKKNFICVVMNAQIFLLFYILLHRSRKSEIRKCLVRGDFSQMRQDSKWNIFFSVNDLFKIRK